MKEFVKLLSNITGIFRSVVTILFLLGIVFTALVDVNLLVAFVDMLGFSGISKAIIKPIFFIIFTLMFVINFIITRHIFKAGKTGEFHLSNLVFSIIFLSLCAFVYVIFRRFTTPILYVFFIINGLIFINSILGLILRTKGEYIEDGDLLETEPANPIFIEFEEESSPVKVVETNKDDNTNIVNERKITADNKVITKTTSEIPVKSLKEDDNKNLGENEKIVFESNTTNTTNSASKKIDNEEAEINKPIKVVDVTNKISRSEKISENETYQSSDDN